MKPSFEKVRMSALAWIFSLMAFSHPPSVQACIWVDGVDLHGLTHQIDGGEIARFTADGLRKREHDLGFWQSYAVELEEKMVKDGTARARSNYAGALLHLREFAKARDILLETERISPGDYAVAANLGTAYELLGDNVNALKWIRTGVTRNTDSHHGTEWVHVKILEAKIAAASEPSWLKTHSVVGAEFGSDVIPKVAGKTEESPSKHDPNALICAIEYQLKERLEFVSAPDPYVGDLLFDLANAMATSSAVNLSVGLYEMAQEYRAPKSELLAKRLNLARDLVNSAEARKTRNVGLLTALAFGVIAMLVFWLRIRRKRRLASLRTV